jgi:hypothetical protein
MLIKEMIATNSFDDTTRAPLKVASGVCTAFQLFQHEAELASSGQVLRGMRLCERFFSHKTLKYLQFLDIRFYHARCSDRYTAIAAAACVEQQLIYRLQSLAQTQRAIRGPMAKGATREAAVIGSMACSALQKLTKHIQINKFFWLHFALVSHTKPGTNPVCIACGSCSVDRKDALVSMNVTKNSHRLYRRLRPQSTVHERLLHHVMLLASFF